MYEMFPTTVYKTNKKVLNKEKNDWVDIIFDNLNEEGFTQDILGFYQIHHRKEVEGVYKWIMSEVRKYLEGFEVDHSNMDLHVTKSFVNMLRVQETPIHEHSENHLTFTYYPHIAKGREQDLRVYMDHHTHPNEPYTHLFDQISTTWNNRNSLSRTISIEEGDLVILPAKLRHSTHLRDPNMKGLDSGTFKRSQVRDSRVCVVGDIMITQKERCDNLWRVLSPIKDWRTFS